MEIVYEVTERWPSSGPLQVTVPPIQIDIPVSPETARRRANGYLAIQVALLLGTSDPRLLMGDPLTWKLSVNLHLPSIGYVGQIGSIHVTIQPAPSRSMTGASHGLAESRRAE